MKIYGDTPTVEKPALGTRSIRNGFQNKLQKNTITTFLGNG